MRARNIRRIKEKESQKIEEKAELFAQRFENWLFYSGGTGSYKRAFNLYNHVFILTMKNISRKMKICEPDFNWFYNKYKPLV